MAKKRGRGHYCKICGEFKANEKFSGKGHAVHICKSCASLPIERKNELQRINGVDRIAEKLRLTKEEWDLLEKYSKNRKYPELKEYATEVLERHRELRESRKPQIEEISFSELEEELKEEIADFFYDDIIDFIIEQDFIPEKKHLQNISDSICKTYLHNFHLHIIQDNEWNELLEQNLKTVIADLKADEIIPQSYEENIRILETERLQLRMLTKSDLDNLCMIMEKPEIMYAWEHGFTRSETRKWINRQLTRYRKDGYGYFAVLLKETGELIGQAGLMKNTIENNDVTELGFIFDNQYWGKGYATESANALVNHAFEKLKINRLYCSIRPLNETSIRVAEKIGMTRTGEHIVIYNDIEMLHYIYIRDRNDLNE